MLDPFFPQAINAEETYDDFAVTVVKQFDLSHCIERNVKVTMHGSDIILDVSILQTKAWPKKYDIGERVDLDFDSFVLFTVLLQTFWVLHKIPMQLIVN